jgi:hypothetical protein
MTHRIAPACFVAFCCVAGMPSQAKASCVGPGAVHPVPDACLDDSPIAQRFRVAFLEEQAWCNDQGEPPCSEPVDAALKSLPGLTDIVWHHRERFDKGDPSAAATPLG